MTAAIRAAILLTQGLSGMWINMKDKHETREARISQLLEMAYDTNSKARVIAIAEQVLELDHDNPEALLLKAEHTKSNDRKTALLKRALESLNKSENINYNDRDYLLYQINEGLALMSFMADDYREAFKYCVEASRILNEHEDFRYSLDVIDDDNGYFMTVYYRVMIELKEWQKILAESMRDEYHSTSWAYSRLIAAYMLAPEHGRVYANMFWDFLRISPEAPFYLLGYYDEPDDNDDENSLDDFNFALMFYDTLTISDDFKNWFNRGTILFGLLTNRFDSREHDYMIDALDVLGGYEEYEKISGMIVEGDDEAVIELLSSNQCLTD